MAAMVAPSIQIPALGPANPGMSILLPQAEAVVAATPFNRWDAVPTPAQAGASFVSITLARAARSFLTRCSLSSAPADAALFSALPILEFGLNAACWTRIFDGLSESDHAGLPGSVSPHHSGTLSLGPLITSQHQPPW